MSDTVELTHEQLQQVYEWIDQIPLSRPKRNIARDFADGVLMSEVVKYFFPKAVDLHNYSKSSSYQQKITNWNTLNQKVFRRMNFVIHDDDIHDIVNHKRGTIERVLLFVQHQFASLENVDGNHNRSRDTSVSEPSPSHPSNPSTPPHHIPQQQQQQPQYNHRMDDDDIRLPSISPPKQRQPKPNAINNNNNTHISQQNRQTPAQVSTTPLASPESAFQALQQALQDRDTVISDLKETVDILQNKIATLEKLVAVKDTKIQKLMQKLGGK